MDSSRQRRAPLIGYSDRLSASAGETIEFKLSADGADRTTPRQVRSWLMHCICADPNPAGPGIIERSAGDWYEDSEHAVVEQAFQAGSCGTSPNVELPSDATIIELSAIIWPTLLDGSSQCILSWGALALCINDDNILFVQLGERVLCLAEPLSERRWFRVELILQRKGVQLEAILQQFSIDKSVPADHQGGSADCKRSATVIDAAQLDLLLADAHRVVVAARQIDGRLQQYYNGKLEAPCIRATNPLQDRTWSVSWDFSRDMHSRTVADCESRELPLTLHNLPTRAMTGSQWQGDEMCWRHAAEQYAAIHFHDDDLVAFNWSSTFSFTVPDDMPSGIYVMRISDGDHDDAMPFFVCAPAGKPGNRICMLVPTFTYAIYGNHARPDWHPGWQQRIEDWNAYPCNPAEYPGYGLSTYNHHRDGSGICHASHRRPLFNLRPGYSTFGESSCSGLRHFQADSHLWAWLDAMNLGFDVITDRELHEQGVACIAAYDVLLTSSHPEYHTMESLDALQQYRDGGGHLSYLGGNGFYWRIAVHPEQADVLEIRRAEAGIRAWASEPGEYYHAFDGQYGGLWRRNGRPPQRLCGLGFSAQGEFNGSHYRRCNHDPAFDWIFRGIDSNIIGDFGLSGGGAAGFELDRADYRLGTPTNATILATSEGHGDDFILVPEEMLTHLTTLPGAPTEELLHANIIWFEVAGGGSVFAVGSITFCGSLPCNDFDNPVSRLLLNVVEHVLHNE
ncbi:N,N-dimethylformamidase beta subunit family domain-containing protein [Granulosicoccus sp. 3-233]|uniref:N,N-dimethylformamidase beta subunit family domain-containing protein n=1 Tax=Granulosicoccus sp. 3-233 TaxID=3417969 RepID=UPI003D33B74B